MSVKTIWTIFALLSFRLFAEPRPVCDMTELNFFALKTLQAGHLPDVIYLVWQHQEADI